MNPLSPELKATLYQTEIKKSIIEIQQAEWDSLDGSENILVSHGWLKTIEECLIEKIRFEYILLKNTETGKIEGAAVCHLSYPSKKIETLDNLIFGRLKGVFSMLRIRFLPAYVCHPPFSYGTHFLFSRHLDEASRIAVMGCLLDTIEKQALLHRLPIAFINALDTEKDLFLLLKKKRYLKGRQIPLNHMDVDWQTFDEYLDHLKTISRHMKKMVKKQINKNEREGVSIRALGDSTDSEKKAYELVFLNHLKHNNRPFMFDKTYIQTLRKNLGDNAQITVAEKNSDIIGANVLLQKKDTGYLMHIGIDQAKSKKDYTYFNLGYYRPIKQAINEGTRMLYDGRGHYLLKARRGFRTKDLDFYYKPSNPVKSLMAGIWFPILARWIRFSLPERKNGIRS